MFIQLDILSLIPKYPVTHWQNDGSQPESADLEEWHPDGRRNIPRHPLVVIASSATTACCDASSGCRRRPPQHRFGLASKLIDHGKWIQFDEPGNCGTTLAWFR